ncbi:MAG TPA: peptidoglycan-binding protein, partial [Myxococcales bacterium]|nr:peptidoglycan-binding protein [Myxococcales bacterium]
AKPDDNGRLSRRYEGTGPGTISGGAGDPGGASYGEYQFSSKQGTAGAFAKWLEGRHPDWAAELSGAKPGTKEFNAAWSKIAREHPDEFADAQYAYAKQAFYKPAAQNVKNATGLDVGSRSHALQEVLFSTAIQHGTGGARSIFKAALAGKDPSKMSDEEIIRAIYAERGRTDAGGVPVHFRNASPAVQRGVLNRFRHEVEDALDMLQREQQCPPSNTITNPPT